MTRTITHDTVDVPMRIIAVRLKALKVRRLGFWAKRNKPGQRTVVLNVDITGPDLDSKEAVCRRRLLSIPAGVGQSSAISIPWPRETWLPRAVVKEHDDVYLKDIEPGRSLSRNIYTRFLLEHAEVMESLLIHIKQITREVP